MVALSAPAGARARGREGAWWALAAVGVVIVGLAPRVLLTTSGVGGRSAAVMAVLLSLGVWLATWLVRSPRAAFVAVGLAMIGFDLASLRPTAEPPFDDRVALYRTDRTLDFTVFAPGALQQPTMLLLVEPTFEQSSPPYRLTADVNGQPVVWNCPLVDRRMQWLALPVPPEAVRTGQVNVRLGLAGAPDREGNYLTVYSLRQQVSPPLMDGRARPPDATACEISGG